MTSAFRRLQEKRRDGEEGFTLIELLVVIIIIGILAAIAIPVYLNQRQKAQLASVKSDLQAAATAAETLYTDNQTYAGMTVAALQGVGFKTSPNNTLGVVGTFATATTYCLAVGNSAAATTWSWNSANANSLAAGPCT